MVPSIVVLDHVNQEAIQHEPMANSLEEGKILIEDDNDSINNVLKIIDRWD